MLQLLSLCALLLLTPPVYAANEPDAQVWLAEMRFAMSHLNYRGTVTYSRNNQIEILRVYHGVVDGVEHERILSVNSPMREVIREQGKVTCYFPESRSLSTKESGRERPFLRDLPEDLNGLARYYVIKPGEAGVVAQRSAHLIAIDPRDAYRYKRALWVDDETRLPLKYELIDENGNVIEQMLFSDLSLEKKLPASDLAASTHPDASWTVKHNENLPADKLRWTLSNVPEGFGLTSYTRLKRGGSEHEIDHILLSDGLSSVSVYTEELPGEGLSTHRRKMGAISLYARQIGNYQITVLGEVPFKTVKAIGDGIHAP
ncbi:MucB/RseB C-terminal domain-containing protein [Candidatus Methylospira mobilis]|nr:MucB/RseB C-terminal domain-containing protein [Candidatus Methylospira mobilis]